MILRATAAWSPSLDACAPATVVIIGGEILSVTWGAAAETAAVAAERASNGDLVVITIGPQYTLLPGLIDAHAHPTFMNSFDFDVSADTCAVATCNNLATMLQSGFTSINSAAACKLGVEAVLRGLVHSGTIEGPRWRTAGPELTPTGGLGAGTVVSPFETDCFGYVCDGVDALVAAVEECAAYNVDAVKLNVSGEELVGEGDTRDVASTFSLAETKATVAAARQVGVRVATHSRGSRSVSDALDAGVGALELFPAQEDGANAPL